MFHQVIVRYPKLTTYPTLNRVNFELEFLRAETFQDWVRLCDKQENQVDQKEVMRSSFFFGPIQRS
jgi:hypothetical protein